MTVQELIDKLSLVKDKSIQVAFPEYEYGGYDIIRYVATAKMLPVMPGRKERSEANSDFRFHTDDKAGQDYIKELTPVCLIDAYRPCVFSSSLSYDYKKAELETL